MNLLFSFYLLVICHTFFSIIYVIAIITTVVTYKEYRSKLDIVTSIAYFVKSFIVEVIYKIVQYIDITDIYILCVKRKFKWFSNLNQFEYGKIIELCLL